LRHGDPVVRKQKNRERKEGPGGKREEITEDWTAMNHRRETAASGEGSTVRGSDTIKRKRLERKAPTDQEGRPRRAPPGWPAKSVVNMGRV